MYLLYDEYLNILTLFARDSIAVCYISCNGDENRLANCSLHNCAQYDDHSNYYCYAVAVSISCCKE